MPSRHIHHCELRKRVLVVWLPVFSLVSPWGLSPWGRAARDLVGPQFAADADRGRCLAARAFGGGTVPVRERRGVQPRLEGLLVPPACHDQPRGTLSGRPEQLEALEAFGVVNRPRPCGEPAREFVPAVGRHGDRVNLHDRHMAHDASLPRPAGGSDPARCPPWPGQAALPRPLREKMAWPGNAPWRPYRASGGSGACGHPHSRNLRAPAHDGLTPSEPGALTGCETSAIRAGRRRPRRCGAAGLPGRRRPARRRGRLVGDVPCGLCRLPPAAAGQQQPRLARHERAPQGDRPGARRRPGAAANRPGTRTSGALRAARRPGYCPVGGGGRAAGQAARRRGLPLRRRPALRRGRRVDRWQRGSRAACRRRRHRVPAHHTDRPGGPTMNTADPTMNTAEEHVARMLRSGTDAGQAGQLARLRARLADHAAAAGFLDVAYRTLDTAISPRVLRAPARLDAAARQIGEYLAGQRASFDLPVDLRLARGYRRTVLTYLPAIGYGRTASYAAVAAATGNPKAVRAAGTACATNPLPLVIPCHRVIRSDGTLGAYAGGTEAKRTLLDLEAAGHTAG